MSADERPSYSVRIEPAAWKQIMALSAALQQRIFAAIEALEIEPRPARVVKLPGANAGYRVRVAAYRIIYEIHDEVLSVSSWKLTTGARFTENAERAHDKNANRPHAGLARRMGNLATQIGLRGFR